MVNGAPDAAQQRHEKGLGKEKGGARDRLCCINQTVLYGALMGKSQRDKGYRTENNVRIKAVSHDLAAYRVPLSGGASIKGDVVVTGKGGDWVIEVKCRRDGFKQIYEWLGDNDALVIKADNKRELVVLDMGDFFDLLAGKHDLC